MGKHELRASRENLISTFEKDAIGRNSHVLRFCSILSQLDYAASVAVDGRWGSGKTFYVRQAKMLLDSMNDNNTDYDDSEKEKIHRGFEKGCPQDFEGIHFEPQVCVYYDAWKNDDDEDPILSLLYQIVLQTQCNFEFSSESNFSEKAIDLLHFVAMIVSKGALGRLSTFLSNNIELIGSARDTAKTLLLSQKGGVFDTISQEKELEKSIKSFLDELLPLKGNRLIIMVDELDRCKPTFAVRLLERIKHFLDNDRITFAFSVNLIELQHTICQYYGANFDAGRYLDRFFDLRFSVPELDRSKFTEDCGFLPNCDFLRAMSSAVIEERKLEMRENTAYKNQLGIVTNKFHFDTFQSFRSRERFFLISLFVPVMMGLKVTSPSLFEDFVYGRDCSALISTSRLVSAEYFDLLFGREETKILISLESSRDKIEKKLEELYHAVFSVTAENNENEQQCVLGQIHFNRNLASCLRDIVGLQYHLLDYKCV